jgi:hypothetical protein
MDKMEIFKWASMPYWSIFEAIALSMEVYDEEAKELVVTVEEARVQHKEFEFRCEILNRAEQMGLIQFHSVNNPNSNLSGKSTVLDPVDFVIWATDNLSSISAELCDEVRKQRKKSKQSKPANDKTGNPGSDARWSTKREILTKAENYVKNSLKDGCEFCDHNQLAEYMYNNASDDDGNLIFEYPNVDEPTLLKYLKEGAKSSLSDHPERIVGKKGYKKSDGACEVHQVKR